ncbi:MAG: hypothetical protein V4702_03305 [Patescibacteria group bacterium]
MTKTMTVGFGSIILGITYYASLTYSPLLTFLLDVSPAANILRATAVLLVTLYYFAPNMRIAMTKFAMQFLGLGLIFLGLTGLLTAQLYSSFHYYALPLDMFFAINWGVVALLISLEHPIVTRRATFSVTRSIVRAKAKKAPRMRTTTA